MTTANALLLLIIQNYRQWSSSETVNSENTYPFGFFSFIAVITMILYVILYLFPFLQANLYKLTPVVAESQMVCLAQL